MSTMDRPKQRMAFTDIERQRLRLYHQECPSLTPQQLASWLEVQLGRKVSNSSVYDILSKKYAYLDNAEATHAVRKKKGPQWADLERALFIWWKEVQPRDITGKELKVKANSIWQSLPACHGKNVPSFSDGWLSNWRVRHGLAQATRSMNVEVADLAQPLGRITSEFASKSIVSSSRDFHTSPYWPTWKGVHELFLKCNAPEENSATISGKFVADVLEPLLSSTAYHHFWLASESAVANMKMAQHLFFASENFRLQLSRGGLRDVILEDWLLDSINTEALRSTSPETEVEGGSFPAADNFDAVIPFRRPKRSKCRTTILSSSTRDGSVSFRAQALRCNDEAELEQATDYFQIVITPPKTARSVPQTVIQLARQRSGHMDTLSMPTISFQTIIPYDSEIFNVAKRGNSRDLQMILASGEASLTDCDPDGRSLINYALRGRNSSTLKFLITKVEDIDAVEANATGHKVPLITLLDLIELRCHFTEETLSCLKMMLLADADPSVGIKPGLTLGYSPWRDGLRYGVVESVKAMLDLAQPYVDVEVIDGTGVVESPLLYLAKCLASYPSFSRDVHQKAILLLERGADVSARNYSGQTCLHLTLKCPENIGISLFSPCEEGRRKDFLMCVVSAGADVYAVNREGRTVSQTAYLHGHERLWREVLAECGYDPDEVFFLEGDFEYSRDKSPFTRKHFPGMGLFSSTMPNIRPTKLSFKEYSQERKLLKYIRKPAHEENFSRWWDYFVDNSDSESETWRPLEHKKWVKMTIPGGYPPLLHDGIHWRTAFS